MLHSPRQLEQHHKPRCGGIESASQLPQLLQRSGCYIHVGVVVIDGECSLRQTCGERRNRRSRVKYWQAAGHTADDYAGLLPGQATAQIPGSSQATAAELRPYGTDSLLPYILGDQRGPLAGDQGVTVAARCRWCPQHFPVRGLRGDYLRLGGEKSEIVADAATSLHHARLREH